MIYFIGASALLLFLIAAPALIVGRATEAMVKNLKRKK